MVSTQELTTSRKFPSHAEIDVWLQHRPNPNASFRLFCFPPSGVGASLFRRWYRYLPREIDVFAVQLPGRETRLREAPYVNLSSAAHTLAKIMTQYSDLPFACYGHSMGAILAFEVARELRNLGSPGPSHLFVGACPAPQLPRRQKPIRSLPDGEFLAELSRRYGAIPEEVMESSELAQLFLVPLRADFTMLEEWGFVKKEPLDCPITAFGGLQDQSVTREEIAAWTMQTHSTFSLSMLPGGHLFVRESYQSLLKAMVHRLHRTCAESA
jgi:medium-chain acyl-[acyl-carrier-protein] hydrolase